MSNFKPFLDKVKNRVSIPEELIPKDAQVEIEAKKAAGYYSDEETCNSDLAQVKGRDINEPQ